MKHKLRNPLQTLLTLLILATTQIGYGTAETPNADQGDTSVAEAILPSARFDLKDIAGGRHTIVGRLGLRRQFLGTRADPPYQDRVQFHCFDGEELKFSSFTDPKLQARLSKRLADGRPISAVITIRFEHIRVGHDGINMTKRLVAHIEDCVPTTAESICAAAEAVGFDAKDSERFKATLNPDLVTDGIAVSLGNIFVRSKTTPRGSALAIHGIRVFNTTPEVATIEITGVKIEQGGVSQRCEMSERSQAPRSWQVEATGWSDGAYEEGKMPRVLWMFDPSGPIEPEKKVKVQFRLKLNGGEPLILTRIVDPI